MDCVQISSHGLSIRMLVGTSKTSTIEILAKVADGESFMVSERTSNLQLYEFYCVLICLFGCTLLHYML